MLRQVLWRRCIQVVGRSHDGVGQTGKVAEKDSKYCHNNDQLKHTCEKNPLLIRKGKKKDAKRIKRMELLHNIIIFPHPIFAAKGRSQKE